MKKTKEEIKHMFDDVELPADMTLEGNTPHTNNMFSSINNTSDGTAEYLKQILDIMRQLEKLQEQNTRIQNQNQTILDKQNNIIKRLEDFKNIKVGLSPNANTLLSELPYKISQEVRQSWIYSAKDIKDTITKHVDFQLKALDELTDKRIEKEKIEIGADKAIHLSSLNYWTMLLMTIISVAYAVYTSFKECLWNEIFERIWLPFLFIIGIIGALVFIFWLNNREYRTPKY